MLKNSFDRICILYEEDYVDAESFEKIFANTIVRYWKIFEYDINEIRKSKPGHCKNFEHVATHLIKKKINPEPYCS